MSRQCDFDAFQQTRKKSRQIVWSVKLGKLLSSVCWLLRDSKICLSFKCILRKIKERAQEDLRKFMKEIGGVCSIISK